MSITAPKLIPEAVAPFLDALMEGDLDAAADAVPDGALSALPAGGVETAPRAIVRRRDSLREALAPAFGAKRAELLCAVTHGAHACLVEGRLTGPGTGPAETFLASFRLEHGRIARQLVYVCPLVEPSPSWNRDGAGRYGDARSTVDRYFKHLDASEFEAAAECFSPDVLYSHPPYGHGLPRAEFRGRDELLAGLRRRGPKPEREHHIELSPQSGPECFLEGYTIDHPQGGSFISSLSLDSAGRIHRYLAVYCEPVVPAS
jgi:hypothetical protein